MNRYDINRVVPLITMVIIGLVIMIGIVGK